MGTKIPTLSTLKIVPKILYFGQAKGSGLFGQAQPQSNSNAYSQQANTSAFGQPASSASGFGTGFGSVPNAPRLPPTNLFGGSTNTSSSAGPFGGFGSTNAPTAPTGGGLFGTTTPSVALAPTNADSAPTAAAAPTREGAGDEFELLTPLPEMEIPGAVAKENSLAANFQVRGTANIKSDGSSHRVAIAIMDLTADIYSMVIPRSLNGAYLHVSKVFEPLMSTHSSVPVHYSQFFHRYAPLSRQHGDLCR